jgi:hypothetical protein
MIAVHQYLLACLHSATSLQSAWKRGHSGSEHDQAGRISLSANDESRAERTQIALIGFDDKGSRVVTRCRFNKHLTAVQKHSALLLIEANIQSAAAVQLYVAVVGQRNAQLFTRAGALVGQPHG